MYYIFNGKLLEENDQVNNSPLSDGVMYGYGLFETIKIKSSKALFINEHLKRLRKGLNDLGIICYYSDEKIKKYINQLIYENKINGALKIAVVKNKTVSDLIILMKKSNYNFSDYKKGYHLKISKVLRNSTSTIVKYKTINYLENILELKKAKKEFYDEVIFFNEKGYLCEGALSNIFLVKDGKIYTPSLNNGLLNGIVRQKLIEMNNGNIIEKNIEKEFLFSSDEVFITNSLMEVMPIFKIEDKSFNMKSYKFSSKLREEIRKEGING